MAGEKSPTPEKQLLNLIENPNAQKATQGAKLKHRSLISLFSPGAWLGRFSFFKGHSRQWFKFAPIQQIDIKLVNNALALLVVFVALYFITDFSNSYRNLKSLPSVKARVQQASAAKEEQVSMLLKTAAYYSELARKRDIFKIGAKPTDKSRAIRAPSDKLKEAIKNLRMVGIAWSNDPDVMIEDTKLKRTYFLKRGQSLDNGVKLQAVFKDKIILSFENEEIEFK
jgi:hypothetical protein